ncbi:MAG: Phage shock protein PspC (stress-responsive transcriptional regulator) [Bacteroidetes bacterium]|nr:Phage shock protein PspC (stress-responsive transcriptional regulator) [Bacteroidota bacterium]
MNNVKRLCKSRTNRMIDGVCGGVAEYFGLDPTLVRIVWVLLTLLGGSGILLYIAGMIIMPAGPYPSNPADQPASSISSSSNHRFWGILLVVVGSLWLMSNLGVWHRWWGFSWDLLLPTVLILAGVAFLFGGRNYVSNQKSSGSTDPSPAGPDRATDQMGTQPSKLYRSRIERKLFGVCGGLGVHFGVDPTIVRVLFVISAFASFGLTILAYVLMAVIVPDEPLPFTTHEARP